MKTAALISSVASALALSDGAPPTRIQLLAMGANETRNGVPPKVVIDDRGHAEAIAIATMAAFKHAPIVVDYDHQTVRAYETGGRAAAAGWMTRITGDETGVWADVEWNDAAASAIAAREYRFVSPFFTHRKDGRVVKVINAGLTNTPNLDLMALASAGAASTEEDDDDMKFVAIATALGLAATAEESAILAAISAVKSKGDALDATATALGLTLAADGDLTAVATAATALKSASPDPKAFVPMAVFAEVRDSVASMQSKLGGSERAQMIKDAGAALTPKMKEYAESLTDTAALASFLGALPENSLGKAVVEGGAKPGEKSGELTDEEKATASMLSISHEDFLKAKQGDK